MKMGTEKLWILAAVIIAGGIATTYVLNTDKVERLKTDGGAALGEESAAGSMVLSASRQLASYTWAKWNISFRYPKTLTVHMPGEDRLFVNEETRIPEGTLTQSWTRMDIVRDTSMTKRLNEYRSLPQFSENKVTFGRNTFTRITYRDPSSKQPVTRYIKELNNILFEYTVGVNEGWLASTILGTMVFPKQ